MNKLYEAFHKGKRAAYTFTPWNDVDEPLRPSQQAWNDYHAEVLAILLAGIPQQDDNKHRMDALVELADELTELHFK